VKLIERLELGKKKLLDRFGTIPPNVIVLGSGLGDLADEIVVEAEMSFEEIFPVSHQGSVQGHRHRLVKGRLGKAPVLCVQGRQHYYEGHSMEDVTFPARLLAWSGAELFILTNAAGGLDPAMTPPALVVVRDHLNLMNTNPLFGPHDSRLGERFVDLSAVYDRELSEKAVAYSHHLGTPVREGVYVALSGPTYETPAEAKMLRLLGGDVVGMSTVPEAIVLAQMKKRVVCFSCVTNLSAGVELTHGEVLDQARGIHQLLKKLIGHLLGEAG